MKILAVVLSVFLWTEFASAQILIGILVAKSRNTKQIKGSGVTRDVQVEYKNSKRTWHRVPEEKARKMKPGFLCTGTKKDLECYHPQSREGWRLRHEKTNWHLQRIFVGAGETKSTKKTP